MEAVKNSLTGFGRDARSFVVNADPDLVSDPRDGDLDEGARRREADGVVDDCVDRTGQAVGLAHNGCAVLARAGEGEASVAGFAACLPAMDKLLDERAEVDALECRAGEFGIGARGFADVTDQPVQTGNVLAN